MTGERDTAERVETNYLATVSDLMAGLLFIFVLTLMIFAIQYSRAAERQEEQNRKLSEMHEIREQMLRQIQQALKDQGVDVKVDYDKGIISIPERVLFPSGSASVTETGDTSLAILGKELLIALPCYSHSREPLMTPCLDTTQVDLLDAVFIEGHTDSLPLKDGAPFRDNWELSAARSINSYNRMLEHQPLLDQLANESGERLFGVSGYAARRPVSSNENEEGRSTNRRIDLRFVLRIPRHVPLVSSEEATTLQGGHGN